METNKKLYQKPIGIIALLILFFPVGLYLMWRYTNWNKFVKFGVTGFFVLLLIISQSDKSSTTLNTQADNPTQAITKPIEKPVEHSKNIDVTGKVEPSIATKGEKVVITIEVTNLDKTQPINGMRILFADSSFIDKGLSIVNVMSGGTQDGRAFVWNNELMKIPPKEKRDFVIVAKANETGSYESTITFGTPSSPNSIMYDYFDQELKAKLIVY